VTPKELATLASVPSESERWGHSAKRRLDDVLYHELQGKLYSQAVCGKFHVNLQAGDITETLRLRLVAEGFKVREFKNLSNQPRFKVSFE
jgi:hypothetical protein